VNKVGSFVDEVMRMTEGKRRHKNEVSCKLTSDINKLKLHQCEWMRTNVQYSIVTHEK
jgi:hypothetical protein